MGIYVHPLTKDPVVLEQLAGVPQGTSARLRTIELQHPYHLTDDGEGQALFDAVVADDDLESLWHFELSGWGRVSTAFYAAVGQDGEYCCGAVHTPAAVARLASLQGADLRGVPIEKLGGIRWG
jgi:hypothetical protein